MSRERNTPTFGVLDPSDWTTNDISVHLRIDAKDFIARLSLAESLKNTDELINVIQDYYGKVRSWLQLYGSVTKQEIVE